MHMTLVLDYRLNSEKLDIFFYTMAKNINNSEKIQNTVVHSNSHQRDMVLFSGLKRLRRRGLPKDIDAATASA